MVQAPLIHVALETLVAHQRALAALETASTAAEVTAGLKEIAGLQRRAGALARDIEIQVIEYGRPALLVSLLDAMRRDADQIARGFSLVATLLDQMRRRLLAGSCSLPEISEIVRTQAQIGTLYFEQLDALVGQLRVAGPQVTRYFDAAFVRIEADPSTRRQRRRSGRS